MGIHELRDLSEEDLEGKLAELQEERFRLRFRAATEAIENPVRFRTLRRDIARVKTLLHERAGQAEGTEG
ncbi:MAG: 50S ribosomal protein L29 [Gemmatimonadales bacterium]